MQILIGLTILLVVAAGVTAALRNPTPDFDPDSPEGVVKAFVEAILAGDVETAASLQAEGREPCSFDNQSIRVTYRSTEVRGDRATVTVVISTVGGSSPFDTYESSYEDRFRLESVDGRWKVVDGPWPFSVCPDPPRG